jgi:hypothetical protein
MVNRKDIGQTLPGVSNVVLFENVDQVATYFDRLPKIFMIGSEQCGGSNIISLVIGGVQAYLISPSIGCQILVML